MKISRAVFLLAISLLFWAANTNAAVMTFSGLSGTQSGPYTENGLTATPPSGGVLWAWPTAGVAHLDPQGFGNEYIDFTFAGGAFDLLSVDILTSGGTGSNNGLWEAFSGATLVGSLVTSSTIAQTISFGSAFAGVDRVRVTNPIGTNHWSFDNVAFRAAVPEPSILALFGLGLVGLGFARRRDNSARECAA